MMRRSVACGMLRFYRGVAVADWQFSVLGMALGAVIALLWHIRLELVWNRTLLQKLLERLGRP